MRCMASGARPSHFTFQEPSPSDCASVFADEVRCAATDDNEACRRVALRRRHAVDPFALPWQPRPGYVAALATQRRLPYQIDTERRTGIRVAVMPMSPPQQRNNAHAGAGAGGGPTSDRSRSPPPPPPSSGVSLSVSFTRWGRRTPNHSCDVLALN
jgi:hypothetical protein